MPAFNTTIRINGLAQLQHAFQLANKKLGSELEAGLKRAAEPVRTTAETYAVGRISNVGFAWSQMRRAVVAGPIAYIAPVQRGVKSRGRAERYRRPRFADILMGESMKPALDTNTELVLDIMEDVLDKVSGEWERG